MLWHLFKRKKSSDSTKASPTNNGGTGGDNCGAARAEGRDANNPALKNKGAVKREVAQSLGNYVPVSKKKKTKKYSDKHLQGKGTGIV